MNLINVNDLANFVKKERQNRGWTQAELATRSGVSRDWLIGLEKGKQTVEIALVFRTLKALGVQLIAQKPAEPQSISEMYINNLSAKPKHLLSNDEK